MRRNASARVERIPFTGKIGEVGRKRLAKTAWQWTSPVPAAAFWFTGGREDVLRRARDKTPLPEWAV
jgi:hypothetical protein